MERIVEKSLDQLRDHPENDRIFRPLEGDEWQDFLDDVAKFGIREPLIVSRDGYIISGSQRARAARATGEEKVPVIIRNYTHDSPEALVELVACNIKRRTLTKAELMRAVEVYQEQKTKILGHRPSTRETAEALNLSPAQVTKLTKVNHDLIPELKELFQKEKLPEETAYTLAQLDPEHQRELLEAIQEKKVVPTLEEANEFHDKADKLQDLRRQLAEKLEEIRRLKREKEDLQKKHKAEIEELKESHERRMQNLDNLYREDYASNANELEKLQKERDRQKEDIRKKQEEINRFRNEIKKLKREKEQLLKNLGNRDKTAVRTRELAGAATLLVETITKFATRVRETVIAGQVSPPEARAVVQSLHTMINHLEAAKKDLKELIESRKERTTWITTTA